MRFVRRGRFAELAPLALGGVHVGLEDGWSGIVDQPSSQGEVTPGAAWQLSILDPCLPCHPCREPDGRNAGAEPTRARDAAVSCRSVPSVAFSRAIPRYDGDLWLWQVTRVGSTEALAREVLVGILVHAFVRETGIPG